MKKTFASIFSLMLCLCMLLSCETSVATPQKLQNAVDAFPFSEGYAFIKYGYGKPYTCINQKGESIFTLDTSFTPVTSFLNGCALVKKQTKYYLVDTTGNIAISPENYGYTSSFQAPLYEGDAIYAEMFYDGYFPVYKALETFEGTTYSIGILGTDGKWVLELSDSYLDKTKKPSDIDYQSGYLILDNIWINIKDGNISSQKPSLQDDVWKGGKGVFTDINGNVKLDISEKYPSLKKSGDFYHGANYTYGVFANRFFSLIDRDGNMIFEPYQIEDIISDKIDGDIIVDKRGKTFFVVNKDKKTIDAYTFSGNKISLVLDRERSIEQCCVSPDGSGYMIKTVTGSSAYSFFFFDNNGTLKMKSIY